LQSFVHSASDFGVFLGDPAVHDDAFADDRDCAAHEIDLGPFKAARLASSAETAVGEQVPERV
jgi:hypothetical protein